jgi:anti-sigma factor ChrR (cupin superfamily)
MATRDKDFLIKKDEMAWSSLGEGAKFKLLRYSPESGVWVILLHIDAGGTFQPHRHHGAGDFFMTMGSMSYTDKVATAGDYGYEAMGAFHEATHVTEESELLFIGYGPLSFFDEAGNISFILDGEMLSSIVSGEYEKSITQ